MHKRKLTGRAWLVWGMCAVQQSRSSFPPDLCSAEAAFLEEVCS